MFTYLAVVCKCLTHEVWQCIRSSEICMDFGSIDGVAPYLCQFITLIDADLTPVASVRTNTNEVFKNAIKTPEHVVRVLAIIYRGLSNAFRYSP